MGVISANNIIVKAFYYFFFSFTEMGGGSSYNWMAPSLQSQDISFSMGTLDSPSQESTQSSSLLFNTSKMKPPKRPLRHVGENFGKTRLKPDDSTSQNPQEVQRREIMKLKRRFIRDRKITGEYYAKTQARKNIAREVRHSISL